MGALEGGLNIGSGIERSRQVPLVSTVSLACVSKNCFIGAVSINISKIVEKITSKHNG